MGAEALDIISDRSPFGGWVCPPSPTAGEAASQTGQGGWGWVGVRGCEGPDGKGPKGGVAAGPDMRAHPR